MKQTHKMGLLAAALLAAALAGTALAFSASWERQGEQRQQEAILLRIGEAAKAQGPQAELPASPEPPGLPAAGSSDLREEETAADSGPEPGTPVKETARIPEEGAEIGILEIPRIDAELPVTAGVSEGQLKVSEGWVRQTDMVGSAGNAVIAGHRSYTFGLHFNRLDELEAGDEILFTAADGEAMRFIVEETLTVAPDDPAVFSLPPEGRAQLTLYTCTPIRKATHRLIVRALRLEE